MTFAEWVFHYPVTWLAYVWIAFQWIYLLSPLWMRNFDSVFEQEPAVRYFTKVFSDLCFTCVILLMCSQAFPAFRFNPVWTFAAYIAASLILSIHWASLAIQRRATRGP